jgi:hypothetical protein
VSQTAGIRNTPIKTAHKSVQTSCCKEEKKMEIKGDFPRHFDKISQTTATLKTDSPERVYSTTKSLESPSQKIPPLSWQFLHSELINYEKHIGWYLLSQ